MAGTSGSGPGYGQPPRPIQIACPPPFWLHKGHKGHKGQVTITIKGKAYLKARAYLLKHRHGKPVPIRLICPNITAKPFPAGCKPQILRFDMAAGSHTLTEVSGPVLAPPQEFTYQGNTYTIMSVNPGADSFTVLRNGWLFVNNGAAITDGIGFMACAA
jgi:hypothetical protein